MANHQITLNEQTLQRLFTSDHQLSQLLETSSIRRSKRRLANRRRLSATNGRRSGKAIAIATNLAN